jgi:hypothetical protein
MRIMALSTRTISTDVRWLLIEDGIDHDDDGATGYGMSRQPMSSLRYSALDSQGALR